MVCSCVQIDDGHDVHPLAQMDTCLIVACRDRGFSAFSAPEFRQEPSSAQVVPPVIASVDKNV